MRARSPFLRRFVPALLLLSCLASAFAQDAMTADAKTEVLKGLQDVVTTRAFVPGVDFSKWPTFLEEHRADIDKADTDVAFARELNKALRQFGVTHINFRTPKAATSRATGTTSGLGMQVKKVDD